MSPVGNKSIEHGIKEATFPPKKICAQNLHMVSKKKVHLKETHRLSELSKWKIFSKYLT